MEEKSTLSEACVVDFPFYESGLKKNGQVTFLFLDQKMWVLIWIPKTIMLKLTDKKTIRILF